MLEGETSDSLIEMLHVFRLNGALLRHGAALTAPLGQTQARWQVIGAVAEAIVGRSEFEHPGTHGMS